jgi:hypothetical protein
VIEPRAESEADDARGIPPAGATAGLETGDRPADGLGRGGSLVAATALAVVAVVLLAPLAGGGLVGDDWEHLRLAQRPWGAVLTEPLSYHFIPLGGALHKVLLGLLGLDGTGWAIANGAMLLLAGLAVLGLSTRLFRDRLSGFLAGALLLGSAAFHEVTFWPTVGVVFGLCGILFAVTLGLGFELSAAGPRGSRPVAFAVAAGAACLTYPGTVTAVPISILWYAMTRPPTSGGIPGKSLALARALVPPFAPSALVLALVGATRWVFSRELSEATKLTFDSERLKYLAEGIASIFSLQGSRSTLHTIVTAGLAPDGNSALSKALTVVFVGLAVCAFAAVIRCLPDTGEAFLSVAFLVHLATMAPWVPVAPRHCFLPSLIGLPLAVRLLGRAVESGLRRRRPRSRGTRVGTIALVTAVALLAARRPFLETADLWARSARSYTELGRLLGERAIAQPGLKTLVTVDLPSFLTEGGFTVPFASYNLPRFASFAAPGVLVERFRLRPEGAGLGWGQKVGPTSLRRVQELVLDPTRLVVRFDPRSGALLRLSPEGFLPPPALTADRAPELNWREGAWPWLLVSPGEDLEATMNASPGDWIALRYLSEASSSFELLVDQETVDRVEPSPGTRSAWRTVLRAIPRQAGRTDEGRVEVAVRATVPVTLAGVWVFRPSDRIAPSTTPFLAWHGDGGQASFEVGDEILLPLRRRAGTGTGPTEIEIEVLSSPRQAGALEAEGRVLGLEGSGTAGSPWTRKALAVSGEGPVLRIRSEGTEPLRIRSVRLEPSSPPPAPQPSGTPPGRGEVGRAGPATRSTR